MRFAHRCPKCSGLNTFRVPAFSGEEYLCDLLFFRRYGCLSCNWPFREFAWKLHLLPKSAARAPARDREGAQ